MLVTDAKGTPIGLDVHSASPHEVRLIESLLQNRHCKSGKTKRLLYDKAADSDQLRERIRWSCGLRLIAPYRKKKGQTEARRLPKWDRTLYRIRHHVENTISWLKKYRRVATRWDYHAHLFEGFCHLACLFTLIKRF